jgi:hypothetical protein
VLGQVGVCEEDDVVVAARGGHRVPDDVEGLLEVVGVDVDVEDAELVGLGDLRIGRQRRGELLAGLLVAWVPKCSMSIETTNRLAMSAVIGRLRSDRNRRRPTVGWTPCPTARRST